MRQKKIEGRESRAIIANEFIRIIANCGRRFFHHEQSVSCFIVDDRGRVWFVDKFTKKHIACFTRYWWRWSPRGFSEGGTLLALCRYLTRYVADGATFTASHLGPFPLWYSNGDPWGYGKDMDQVREAANRLGLMDAQTTQKEPSQ